MAPLCLIRLGSIRLRKTSAFGVCSSHEVSLTVDAHRKDMKFGISTFVTDEGIAPGALGRAIEERGFDSLFIAEHTHIPLSRKSPWPRGGELPRKYYRTLDPFITLTAAAAIPGNPNDRTSLNPPSRYFVNSPTAP